jgi:hypothetical protein
LVFRRGEENALVDRKLDLREDGPNKQKMCKPSELLVHLGKRVQYPFPVSTESRVCFFCCLLLCSVTLTNTALQEMSQPGVGDR